MKQNINLTHIYVAIQIYTIIKVPKIICSNKNILKRSLFSTKKHLHTYMENFALLPKFFHRNYQS